MFKFFEVAIINFWSTRYSWLDDTYEAVQLQAKGINARPYLENVLAGKLAGTKKQLISQRFINPDWH